MWEHKYDTSRDYKRLKSLLDSGFNVLVIAENDPSWMYKASDYYRFTNFAAYFPLEVNDADFAMVCRSCNIEFFDITQK